MKKIWRERSPRKYYNIFFFKGRQLINYWSVFLTFSPCLTPWITSLKLSMISQRPLASSLGHSEWPILIFLEEELVLLEPSCKWTLPLKFLAIFELACLVSGWRENNFWIFIVLDFFCWRCGIIGSVLWAIMFQCLQYWLPRVSDDVLAGRQGQQGAFRIRGVGGRMMNSSDKKKKPFACNLACFTWACLLWTLDLGKTYRNASWVSIGM